MGQTQVARQILVRWLVQRTKLVAMTDARGFLLILLSSAWVVIIFYSTYEYSQTRFHSSYMSWQTIAGVLSIVILCVGLSWPKGRLVRRLSGIPLLISIFHIAMIVYVFVAYNF